jgi:hypothetical protein
MAKRKRVKKTKRRERAALVQAMVKRLTPGFGRWCGEHMPKGTKWDDAASDGVMAECVGNFLCAVFPSMEDKLLHRIATINVRIKARRINVDMPGLARAILRAGGTIT